MSLGVCSTDVDAVRGRNRKPYRPADELLGLRTNHSVLLGSAGFLRDNRENGEVLDALT